MVPLLVIDGITIPIHAAYRVTQIYAPVRGGTAMPRARNGALRKHVQWAKLRTTLRGTGNIPTGLEAVDYSASFVLSCIALRGVTGIGTNNVLTLPAARRTDTGYTPRGFAFVDGLWRPAGIALVGDVATITTVAGATQYRAAYYPELTVMSQNGLEDSWDVNRSVVTWSLDAEEA